MTDVKLPRPLDPQSQAILERLISDLADPRGFDLIRYESSPTRQGAPTVAAERLDRCRYLITRYITVDVRVDDPEVDDRLAAPAIEFIHEPSGWFPVAVKFDHRATHDLDIHKAAKDWLMAIEREQQGTWWEQILRRFRVGEIS